MSNIQHEQLKPCPFCGDADALRHSMITGAVFCEGCGCEGPWAPHFDGDWDTRATVTVQDAARVPEIAALIEKASSDAREVFDASTAECSEAIDYFREHVLAALRAIAEGRA